MNIVEIKDLRKTYGNNVALDKVSFFIKEGEIFGLLGPNGSGKSTIINILSGILPFHGGVCKIFNRDIKNKKHKKIIQHHLGVVPQDYCLYEHLKAKENVDFYGRLYGLSSAEIKDKTKNALERVGLWEHRDSFPSTFSGGMKRRLNIACSIVHEPRLIIMDEPTASLDPLSRDYILNTVKELNHLGCTIIYTSHYLEEIEALCSRAVILNKGKVLATGTGTELKKLLPGGSRIRISLKAPGERLLREMSQGGIIKASNLYRGSLGDNNILNIDCDNPAEVLERLLPYLKGKGLTVEDIEVSRTSLEEVFLKLIPAKGKSE